MTSTITIRSLIPLPQSLSVFIGGIGGSLPLTSQPTCITLFPLPPGIGVHPPTSLREVLRAGRCTSVVTFSGAPPPPAFFLPFVSFCSKPLCLTAPCLTASVTISALSGFHSGASPPPSPFKIGHWMLNVGCWIFRLKFPLLNLPHRQTPPIRTNLSPTQDPFQGPFYESHASSRIRRLQNSLRLR